MKWVKESYDVFVIQLTVKAVLFTPQVYRTADQLAYSVCARFA